MNGVTSLTCYGISLNYVTILINIVNLVVTYFRLVGNSKIFINIPVSDSYCIKATNCWNVASNSWSSYASPSVAFAILRSPFTVSYLTSCWVVSCASSEVNFLSYIFRSCNTATFNNIVDGSLDSLFNYTVISLNLFFSRRLSISSYKNLDWLVSCTKSCR
ncbi:hypothetical protein FC45_GL000650 [Lactobacillus jensenii DSM 20557]|nr:hypothetical protein FC45_GL000650 [Lactobacillus jensenii DSM 20557]